MDCSGRKPVFKPACSATATSQSIEILCVASRTVILPRKQITKTVQGGEGICCSHAIKSGFLALMPILEVYSVHTQ